MEWKNFDSWMLIYDICILKGTSRGNWGEHFEEFHDQTQVTDYEQTYEIYLTTSSVYAYIIWHVDYL